MSNINTETLIADYLSGNLKQNDVEQLKMQYDSDRGWQEFKKRIPAWKRRIPFAWRFISIAAALVFAIFFSYHLGVRNIRGQFSEIVVDVPNGSKINVSLPDGSTVFLNSGSRISYSQGFGITDRNVSIDGEGYFEVTRNESLPMRVRSENISIEVLGTEFSYRDYSGDHNTYVALIQGSVKVSGFNEDIILEPGQSAVLNYSTHHLSVSDKRNDDLTAWKDGAFHFDEVSLQDITQQIARSFGLSVTFVDEDIKDLCFYASFSPQDASAEEILSRLSATGAFHYEISGKNVTIRK